MSVFRREIKNPEGKDILDRPLVFHHTKEDSCLMVFAVGANGDLFCARLGFHDTHVLNHNVFYATPDAFWQLLAYDDVREIDVLDLPFFKAQKEKK